MRPTIEEIVEVIAEAVMCDPQRISHQASLDEVPGWDSSSAVYFVGEALGRWGIELSNRDLRECASIPMLSQRVWDRAP